jgi:Mn-dependent DtxR family transcriptional regulator
MKTNTKTKIELVDDLFDDSQTRTYQMVAEDLNLKSKSVSRWLHDLVNCEILQIVGKGICEVTGKEANYYRAIIWTKKALK